MWRLFTARSIYKKRARFAAILWTLLIFIACFIPGNEIPKISVPFIDKWVHFVLFGGFTLLWLMAYPSTSWYRLVLLFVFGCVLGWLVEEIQGLLKFLGHSKDINDIFADAIGALIGVALFYILANMASQRNDAA
jgi:VanZ family protein